MRKLLFVFLLSSSVSFAQQTGSTVQRNTIDTDYRAIRRDVPMTNSILKAFEAGTRNFSGKPGPNYWQLETDFTIQVSLDPHTQTLTGTEKILVHNNSKDDLDRIVLRLDHNIFRGDVPRGFSIPAEQTEGMVVTRINVAGEEIDLTEIRLRRGQTPKNGVSGLKKTIATIYLAQPIKAGSKTELEIDWHTKLPGGTEGQGHRMTQRFDSTLFQPTQWFPRLAKYDDLRGWETSPYLGPAEFYNNFGKFDVSITVPGGWIVSGTGVLQNPKEVMTAPSIERFGKILESDEETTIVAEDERGPGKATAFGEKLTWHFVADKVNDFAWATSADFIWKGTRADIPGKGYVPIYMVYEPERARNYENAARITRHALEFYSKLWAPYPFPQLTLQDGPSAGMEYPMVINSNQGAADHETAHQWWPMMLGTNETRYGWMDEGFNQYMNILSDADSRGVPARLDGLGQSYGRISGSEDEAPLMWSANDAGMGYGFQTYQKTPLMLSMLGGIVGDEAVIDAMKKYTAAWAFKHPSPWDFMFFMNHELGQNLEWFWYYWLFTTESVDGSISDLKTEGGKTTVTVRQDGQMPSPVVLRVEFEANGPDLKPSPNAEILDPNTAEVTWPVDVWWGGSKTFDAVLDFGPRKIKKITLDPHGRFPDRDLSDNVWPKQ
ncbi:M1 family metallopeptidase [Algoriphagus aestuariicola]|uniref:M1 family metallopeptidase n=1 Tax=Algoriphagus aestuariicola TaxID=1852016 RepID=A0ABS3BQF1_9BACT|nr:M1 family metallopeptidase [Algoriphagus aestuariicola]MBN7801136.1 M1 family metallopeptidase [Algoriphagus aestuariicola]